MAQQSRAPTSCYQDDHNEDNADIEPVHVLKYMPTRVALGMDLWIAPRSRSVTCPRGPSVRFDSMATRVLRTQQPTSVDGDHPGDIQ